MAARQHDRCLIRGSDFFRFGCCGRERGSSGLPDPESAGGDLRDASPCTNDVLRGCRAADPVRRTAARRREALASSGAGGRRQQPAAAAGAGARRAGKLCWGSCGSDLVGTASGRRRPDPGRRSATAQGSQAKRVCRGATRTVGRRQGQRSNRAHHPAAVSVKLAPSPAALLPVSRNHFPISGAQPWLSMYSR